MTGKWTKTKTKKPLETSLGRAPKDSDKVPDLSHLRKPITTSVFGLKQVLSLFQTATTEVQEYITYECDVLYECRICRTIYRSLANFILHKRNYCREKFTLGGGSGEDGGFIIGVEDDSRCATPVTVGDEGGTSESSVVDERKNAKKDILPIIDRLLKKQKVRILAKDTLNEDLSSKADSDDDVIFVSEETNVVLQKIDTSEAAVFQTAVKDGDKMEMVETESGLIKSEVMEIHGIFENNEAVLGSNGKVCSFETNKVTSKPNIPKQDLVCTECNFTFSTEKTLTHHIKYKHNKTCIVFPCPDCKETFSNAWSVYRHLYKVHRRTSSQVRRMRPLIHSSGIRKDQEPEKKKRKVPSESDENEENQWMNNFEGDKDLQMCGGCGKRFERKAALHSHSQMCTKRIAVCNSIKNVKGKAESKKGAKNEPSSEVKVLKGAAKRKPKLTAIHRNVPTEVKISTLDTILESTSRHHAVEISSSPESNVDKEKVVETDERSEEKAEASTSSEKDVEKTTGPEEKSERSISPEKCTSVITITSPEKIEKYTTSEKKDEKPPSPEVVVEKSPVKKRVKSTTPEKRMLKITYTKEKREKPVVTPEPTSVLFNKSEISVEPMPGPTSVVFKKSDKPVEPTPEPTSVLVKKSDKPVEPTPELTSALFKKSDKPVEPMRTRTSALFKKSDKLVDAILGPISVLFEKSDKPAEPTPGPTSALFKKSEKPVELTRARTSTLFKKSDKLVDAIPGPTSVLFEKSDKPAEPTPGPTSALFKKSDKPVEPTRTRTSTLFKKSDKSEDATPRPTSVLFEKSDKPAEPAHGPTSVIFEKIEIDKLVEPKPEPTSVLFAAPVPTETKSLGITKFSSDITITKDSDTSVEDESAQKSLPEIEIFTISDDSNDSESPEKEEEKITRKRKRESQDLDSDAYEISDEYKVYLNDEADYCFLLKALTFVDKDELKCVPCDIAFLSRYRLLRHMSSHFSWFRFQCSKCSFVSFNKYDCTAHAYEHHGTPSNLMESTVLPIPKWKVLCTSHDFTKLSEDDTSEPSDTQSDINNMPRLEAIEEKSEEKENGVEAPETIVLEDDEMPDICTDNVPFPETVILSDDEIREHVNNEGNKFAKAGPSKVVSNRPIRNRTKSVKTVQNDFIYDLAKVLKLNDNSIKNKKVKKSLGKL